MAWGGIDQKIPGSLLLQAASANLAVLRNDKGISPVVKLQLRQAAHDLRVALSDNSQPSSVEGVAASLRGCLEMIQNGMTIAHDQKLLDGIGSVLTYLTQFLGETPAPVAQALPARTAPPSPSRPLPVTVVLPETETTAAPDPELGPRPSAGVTAGAVTSPRAGLMIPTTMVIDPEMADSTELPPETPSFAPAAKPRVAISLDAISAMLAQQLARIERLYRARAACIDDPTSTFGDLQSVEGRIRQQEAMAADVLQGEASAQPQPHDDSEVSSIGAWWLLGEAGQLEGGSPALATSLTTIAAGTTEDHRLAIDVLRLNPSHAAITDVWAVLRGPALMPLRARCLPLLFENHLPDGEALVRMLDEEAMAVSAAAALCWCRIRDGSRRLLEKALACPWPQLSDALLLASVTQGDREALSEVRIRLAAGSASNWLIDALAVAGDDTDAHLLLDMVMDGGLPATYAVWAVAHLGASTTLGRMEQLENRLQPLLIDRVIALVANDRDPSRLAALAPGRYVDGRLWSVSAVAQRMVNPTDLPLPILRWTALDLSVRTGEAAPCLYDIGSPVQHQQAAARAFSASYAASLEAREGDWYYFGRSLEEC